MTFRDADGKPAALRADIEELRRQAEKLKKNGPKVKQPSHHVEVFKPDEPEVQDLPPPQTLADHPRAYTEPKLTPYQGPPGYSKSERDVGSGREGLGRGPDPSMVGGARGFKVSHDR